MATRTKQPTKPASKPNRNTRATTRAATVSGSAGYGPTTLDPAGRTVRAIIATDTPVEIVDYEAEEVVDEILVPTGMVEPSRMRLRVDHSRYRSLDVIGRVTDFAIGRHEIEATLRFSAAPDVEPIWQRVAEGHLDAVSIGATYRMRDTIRLEPGQSRVIEGVRYTAGEKPALLVTRWAPDETSVVDTPADARAVIRSRKPAPIRTRGTHAPQSTDRPALGSGTISKGDTMTKRIKRREAPAAASNGPSQSPGTRTSARTERARASTAAAESAAHILDDLDDQIGDDLAGDGEESTQRAATTQRDGNLATDPQTRVEQLLAKIERLATDRAAATGSTTPDAVEVARREERQRVGRIRELGAGQPEKLIARAIDEGWTAEQFGLKCLERLQRQSAGHATRQSGDGINTAPAGHVRRGATIEALQAAVLLRSGINLQNPLLATEQARHILERNHMGWLYQMNAGIEATGNSDAEQFAEVGRRYQTDSAARTCERMLEMTHRDGAPSDVEEIVSRSFSSPYLPRVFGAIVSVGLVEGFMAYPNSTTGWVDRADWADFRDNQPIGLDGRQGLRMHTRGTEAKDVDFGDYGEKYAVRRFSGKFTLDEMDIIDDTVGANQQMPQQIGEMAARLEPDLVCSLLLSNPTLSDNVALFHADRGNLKTSNALSIANLAVAEAAMATQTIKTKSNKVIARNLMAGYLITPRGLRATAKQVANSSLIVSGETAQRGNLNPHDGEYQIRSDARLDVGVINPITEAMVTGAATTWFIAERSGKQALQLGYRRGTGRAPTLRVKRLDQPGQFGIGWDIVFDLGIGVLSPAAMVMNQA